MLCMLHCMYYQRWMLFCCILAHYILSYHMYPYDIILLVVWNIFYFSILYWECHNPNWRTHIFQRGRYTTNQSLYYITSYYVYDPIYDILTYIYVCVTSSCTESWDVDLPLAVQVAPIYRSQWWIDDFSASSGNHMPYLWPYYGHNWGILRPISDT